MNRDDIERLWFQAMRESMEAGEPYIRHRFAALVAAAEREARAKLCEEFDCENPYIGQARAVAFEIRQRNCK